MIRAWVVEAYRRNRLLTIVAAAHLILFLILIPAAALDPVQTLGVSRWIKPMKFAISIAIFIATMAGSSPTSRTLPAQSAAYRE